MYIFYLISTSVRNVLAANFFLPKIDHIGSASEVMTGRRYTNLFILLFFNYSQGNKKKLHYAIQKVQKWSWNEPYSSSCFTKQSCSKIAIALYGWIKTESRWNKKLISLPSPDWSANLRTSLDSKTRPDALIGPNDSTATGWKMWCLNISQSYERLPLLLLNQLHAQLLQRIIILLL